MTTRLPLILLPLALALAACTNHEPVADGDDGRDHATVPADATDGSRPGAGAPVAGTGMMAGDVIADGDGPAVAGGQHAAEAESVAIDETGQAARDAAAAEVAGAEPVVRDDNVNQYDRAPQAADALEGGYNDEDKDNGD